VVLNADNSDLMNRTAPAPAPTTILVVDDDPDVLWSTAKILRDAGFVVLEGAGAADAVKLTNEHCPALVLLDVNLPDGNGVDVALQIKSDPLLSSVFVVLCSGTRITPKDQVDGLHRGLADGYIIRPVGKDELIARIDAFLRIRAALEALRQANKKLNLLSSITRHDILNQLFALKGYLELSHDVIDNPEALREFIKKEQNATNTIEHQILFTKDYQDLGAAAPAWQNVNASIKEAVARLPMRDVRVEVDPKNPEIFADPLFLKVFYNLIDNALRYGGDQIKTIQISSQEIDTGLLIVCEDDGIGISAEDKKRLFTQGFGKNTGLGLFLSREILAITGITITENGTPGKGARFEITVPKGAYRFTSTNEK